MNSRGFRRLLNALRPGPAEDELARETAGHLALLEEDLQRGGMTSEEAHFAARRAFGGVEQMRDRHRDARSFVWLDDLRRDLHHAQRALRRAPGFSAAVVLTLGLGIGANTAIFTIVHAVLIERPAFHDPDRLVAIFEESAQRPGQHNVVSPANLAAWIGRAHSFEPLAALSDARANLTGSDNPEEVVAQRVTATFFPTLGVPPLIGRTFTEAEHRDRRTDAVILGHDLWQRRFGGDPSIVGRTIQFNAAATTVVGVMPRGFTLYMKAGTLAGKPAELWTPYSLPANARDIPARSLAVVARLKPRVSTSEAETEMTAIARSLASEFPDRDAGWTARVVTLQDEMSAPYRQPLLVLWGAVACVLLIACANAANLLLARGMSRRREIAIRMALGAGRGRIVRQLLTESLLLAVAGGMGGMLAARWGVGALQALNPVGVAPTARVVMNTPVVLFAIAASLLTSLICGIAPALATVRAGARGRQGDAGRPLGAPAGARRLHNLFVVSEIALASVLLIGAGLMVRSFVTLRRVDPGFEAARLLTLRLQIPAAKYGDNARRVRFFQDVEAQVQGLPGVRSAGIVSFLPFTGSSARSAFTVEGQPPPPPGQVPSVDISVCDSGYFQTLGLTVVDGRLFSEREAREASNVVIVNRAFARTYFPHEDPLGKRLAIAFVRPVVPVEIVGVVDDFHAFDLGTAPRPTAFWPHPQQAYNTMTLAVRTTGDPLASAPAVVRAIREVDKDQPVSDVRSMSQWIDRSQAQARFMTVVLTAFSLAALALAAIGIFGVISYTVSQRTVEIGVRVALGARPGAIVGMMLRQGITLAAIGAAIGLPLAAGAVRLLTAFLFGVSPLDPITFAGAAVLLVAVGLVACYVPARRATRVDPLTALRCE
jgi:putative ABC transport system permease protein